jgi:NAD(P)-dependent dehydrogenase (short-subunit alcohol dehydrogenase family)
MLQKLAAIALIPAAGYCFMIRFDEAFSLAFNNPNPKEALLVGGLLVTLVTSLVTRRFLYAPFAIAALKHKMDISYLRDFSRAHLVSSSTDLTGKLAVVTGGNSGVGFGAAETMAQLGATVVLGCRSEKRCSAAADTIRGGAKGSVVTMSLDLADYASIAAFAKGLEEHGHVDFLFNNAGFATAPPAPAPLHTKEGLELGLGSMHFGHYYLTRDLMASGLVDPTSRVVNTASGGAFFGTFDASLYSDSDGEGDLRGEKTITAFGQMYSRAKLANVIFSRSLVREHGIPACSMHVGAVATSIWDVPKIVVGDVDVGAVLQAGVDAYTRFIMRNLEQGSRGLIRCALDGGVGGGVYLDGGGNVKSDEQLKAIAPNMVDEKLRIRLEEVSEAFWQRKKN